MAWEGLTVGILEVFAEAQCFWGERRVATEEGGLEALRRWWRQRQAERGECRSCRKPRDPMSKMYCTEHLERHRARARASWRRSTVSNTENQGEKR